MDFIIANDKKIELGFLSYFQTIDFEIGNINDFEITLDLDDWSSTSYGYGYLIYANNTEFGGIIEDMQVITKGNTIKLKGYTWRGLLSQKILEPPDGLPYLIVSGEINSVLKTIIGSVFGDLFIVDDIDSGLFINYQFYRYINMLDGLNMMLDTVGARLKIYFNNNDMMIHLQGVSIIDYSEEIEYSQDNQVHFTTRDYRRGINHLICLGSGELIDREIIHLYLQANGTIATSQYYTGLSERTATFDYGNAESSQDLIDNGMEYFKKILNYTEISMTIEKIEAELGDIVGGRERVTGLEIKKTISQIVLKITGNNETISFKVGDKLWDLKQ